MYVALIIFAVVVVIGVLLYNSLIQRRNRVDNAWSQIDVQLK
ncbi:MAG: LemA family protein, partial [Actinobacteria bacterium]|nr:LemA family protein [Actinomycetota bacterium]